MSRPSNTEMLERAKGLAVKTDDSVGLEDFNGNDATLASPLDIKRQVNLYAVAALPELFKRSLLIIRTSKNEKAVIESMKFISSLANGKVDEKTIDVMAKKLTDEEISKALESEEIVEQ